MVAILWVGIAGSIGTLLRYFIGLWVGRLGMLSLFPVGTLTVNLIGCLVLGWFAQWAETKRFLSPPVRTGISTGLIGSFTTFSTFSAETVQLFRLGRWESGIAYLVISMFGGLCLVWLGTVIGGKKRKEATHG